MKNRYSYSIKRPLVISINIGIYNKNPSNPGMTGIRVDDLPIETDYDNVKKLCNKFNYTLFPKIAKYEWTQQESVNFIE